MGWDFRLGGFVTNIIWNKRRLKVDIYLIILNYASIKGLERLEKDRKQQSLCQHQHFRPSSKPCRSEYRQATPVSDNLNGSWK